MVHQASDRETINISLNARARAIVDGIRDDSGVPKVEAVARIIEWFADLDRKLRFAVLSRDIESQRELISLALKEMVADDATTKDFGPLDQLNIDQLLKLQDQVIHHVAKRVGALKALAARPGEKKKGGA